MNHTGASRGGVPPHVLRVAAAAAGTAAILSGGIVSYVHHRITRPPKQPFLASPAHHGLPYEEIEFFARGDGKRLSGWFIPAVPLAGTHRHAVIAMQGWNRHRADHEFRALQVYEGLARRGIDVLAFDKRGRGLSEDGPNQFGDSEYRDALGAFDWLDARLLAETGDRGRHRHSIGAYGLSMGAAVAILAGAEEPRIAAVVADSAYADVREIIHAMVRRRRLSAAFADAALVLARLRGLPVGRRRPLDAIGRIAPRPLLLVHGGMDDLVPAGDAHRLLARAGDGARLWLVPQAGHVGAFYWYGEHYIDRVAAALKGERSATEA